MHQSPLIILTTNQNPPLRLPNQYNSFNYQSLLRPEHHDIRLNFQPSLDSEDDFLSGCLISINTYSPSQDFFHLDDQIPSRYKMISIGYSHEQGEVFSAERGEWKKLSREVMVLMHIFEDVFLQLG